MCDLVYAFDWGGAIWHEMAFYTMAGGVIGALAAAVPGYIDFRSITDETTQRIGKTHMLLNLTLVGIFIVDLVLRWRNPASVTLPALLSAVGILVLGVSGWWGAELVYVRGMGVEPQATKSSEPRRRVV